MSVARGLVIGPIMTGLCCGYARAIYRAPAQHGQPVAQLELASSINYIE
jgi:hypothetical protein